MKTLFALLLLLCVETVFSQYRFDNVAFKTVYWSDLCQTLAQNPGRLILDVRSKGKSENAAPFKSLYTSRLKVAADIKGLEHLREWVVNVPPDNH